MSDSDAWEVGREREGGARGGTLRQERDKLPHDVREDEPDDRNKPRRFAENY